MVARCSARALVTASRVRSSRPTKPTTQLPRRYRLRIPHFDQGSSPNGVRLAKLVAEAGLCSVREAQRWVKAGRVLVDGKTPTSAGKIRAATAHRTGKCPGKDGNMVQDTRPTVIDNLPIWLRERGRVLFVGRLDMMSEGLLLLTNNGVLKRHLELPSSHLKRVYRVYTAGSVSQQRLDTLKAGVSVDGIHYRGIKAVLDEHQKQGVSSGSWMTVSLSEGKNREIRKVMSSLGLRVTRLIRVTYGPFALDDLAVGGVAEVDLTITE